MNKCQIEAVGVKDFGYDRVFSAQAFRVCLQNIGDEGVWDVYIDVRGLNALGDVISVDSTNSSYIGPGQRFWLETAHLTEIIDKIKYIEVEICNYQNAEEDYIDFIRTPPRLFTRAGIRINKIGDEPENVSTTSRRMSS